MLGAIRSMRNWTYSGSLQKADAVPGTAGSIDHHLLPLMNPKPFVFVFVLSALLGYN